MIQAYGVVLALLVATAAGDYVLGDRGLSCTEVCYRRVKPDFGCSELSAVSFFSFECAFRHSFSVGVVPVLVQSFRCWSWFV